MSTDAWRTVWHPLGGKTSCWSFCMSGFFLFLWSFTVSEHKNEASEKKRAVGLSFFVAVKGKNMLLVFVACYITPCLERKHLWWPCLLNSWKNPEAKSSNMRRRFLQILELTKKNTFVFSPPKKTLCFKKAAEVREALIFFQFLLEMLQQLCTRFLDSYTSIRISK